MINNPMQQIERTQDAYAGNPEGLQKRANMSKELIDLLAMQALQSDLAAQKRNMAMQQQGNPQTVKDQLEEGLMGEYRQEAAKDLGINPSEGDVVERTGIAGQQMAQNAQMPQGPQGMPQGGGGVASQAGPVNLAGGGIVSFDAGGPTSEVGEFLESISLAQDENIPKIREGLASLRKIEKPGIFSPSTPEQRTQRGQLQVGYERAGDLAREIAENPRLIAEFEQLGPEAFALKYLDGASQDLKVGAKKEPQATVTRREAPLNMQEEEERKGRAGTAPPARDVDVSGIASLPKVTEPSLEEQGKLVKDRMARSEETVAAANPPPTPTVDPRQALIDSISGLAAVDPYIPDADLTAYTKKQMERNPTEEAKAAAARVAKFSKLDEGILALTDRKQRAKDLYEERQEAKKGRAGAFMAQMIGASKGGRGAEARMSYYEKQEAIRDKHEANLNAIDDASILLQRTVGAKQATEYSATAKNAETAIANAANTVAGMDATGRSDYLARVKLQVEDQKVKLDLVNQLGREDRENAALTLSRQQITLDTADAILDAATAAIDTYLTQISEARALIMPRFRKRLNEAEGDATEMALIRKEINEELQNATIAQHDLLNEAREKQKEAEKILTSRMTGSSAISGDAGRLITAKKDG